MLLFSLPSIDPILEDHSIGFCAAISGWNDMELQKCLTTNEPVGLGDSVIYHLGAFTLCQFVSTAARAHFSSL
jgi:hypothetical protein